MKKNVQLLSQTLFLKSLSWRIATLQFAERLWVNPELLHIFLFQCHEQKVLEQILSELLLILRYFNFVTKYAKKLSIASFESHSWKPVEYNQIIMIIREDIQQR